MAHTIVVDVVNKIAEEKGIEPSELDYTLHDYVATDALEQLARREDRSWTLSFEIPDGSVTVTSEGGIYVDLAADSQQLTRGGSISTST